MYGHPQSTAFGIERVSNIDSLVEVIKRRQVLRPCGRFSIRLGDANFAVKLLPSGHLEIDGRVQPMAVEREFEEAIASVGAEIDDLSENR